MVTFRSALTGNGDNGPQSVSGKCWCRCAGSVDELKQNPQE